MSLNAAASDTTCVTETAGRKTDVDMLFLPGGRVRSLDSLWFLHSDTQQNHTWLLYTADVVV